MQLSLGQRRLYSGIMDAVVVAIFWGAPWGWFYFSGDFPESLGAIVAVELASLIVPLFLLSYVGAKHRRTVGMRWMGIEFRGLNGDPIGFWRCAGRIFIGGILLPILPFTVAKVKADSLGRTIPDELMKTTVQVRVMASVAPKRRGL